MPDGASSQPSLDDTMIPFANTRWSLIADAGHTSHRSREALEQLCRDYRPPVLSYIRHCGYNASDAEDLTQEFFVRFIERDLVTHADPERGRFRALLLTALRRFLSDQHDREHALKRGGGASPVQLEQVAIASSELTPEQAFTRAWVHTVLTRALARLHREAAERGLSGQYECLAEFLDGRADEGEFHALAERLGVRRNTLSVQLHRMRERLRQLVRLELLQTVGDAEALDAELAELRACLHETLPEDPP